MNSYEEKKKARIERLKSRAESAREESGRLLKSAHEMADVIPFGQPILVGHHSEKADRRFRGRIYGKFDKGFEAQKQAEDLESRARAAESNQAISSDDPDAVQKLAAKIENLERLQDSMKRANAIIRKYKTNEERVQALVDEGVLSEPLAQKIIIPDFAGRVGFPDYQTKNNNANIRRLKARMEGLKRREGAESSERQEAGYLVRENVEENRIQLIFPGKPSAEIRSVLKSWGFRWAPSEGAWQRHLNNAGRFAVQEISEKLASLGS